jgi:hypothetical protein
VNSTRYNKSELGKVTDKRRKSNEVGKASNQRYKQGKAGKAANQRYKQSSIGKAAMKRRRSEPQGRIKSRLTTGAAKILRREVRAPRKFVERTAFRSGKHLRETISAQFDGGFSWDNYGTVWELDHKVRVLSVCVCRACLTLG